MSVNNNIANVYNAIIFSIIIIIIIIMIVIITYQIFYVRARLIIKYISRSTRDNIIK